MGASRVVWRKAVVLAALGVVLGGVAGCGRGQQASAGADELRGAADLVAPGDEYAVAEVGDVMYVLNATSARLSRLGGDGGPEGRVTVAVGAGGPLDLLADPALAVLDGTAGRLEWFDLGSLVRRTVELGRGEWHGLLADEDAAVVVDRRTGRLARVDRRGVAAEARLPGAGHELALALADGVVHVRDLTARRESHHRLSDLVEVGEGGLPGAPTDDLLSGEGTEAPANWLLNRTRGELYGLGVDGRWEGSLSVAAPGSDAQPPVAVGKWVYVLVPSLGNIAVVRADNGVLISRLDVGRHPDLVLSANGAGVTVASVPTRWAAHLEGTRLRQASEAPGDDRTLSTRVTAPSAPPAPGAPAPSRPPAATSSSTTAAGAAGPANPGVTAPLAPAGTPPTPAAPDLQLDLSVSPAGPDALDASWRLVDPAGRVTAFTLTWRSGGTVVGQAAAAAGDRTRRLTGLRPATTYEVTVTASAAGASPTAGPVVATTQAAQLPAPTDVAAAAASDRVIDVSWAVADPHGVVAEVVVAWTAGGARQEARLAGSARQHRLEGLAAATAHVIEVATIGLDGARAASPAVTATTPATPPTLQAQLLDADDDRLEIGWSVEDPSQVVESLAVEVWQGGVLVGRKALAASARSLGVSGLHGDTSYELVVVAIVGGVDAASSNRLVARTT